jgi:hypothetical protein
MLVQVRGGYVYRYHSKEYKGGDVFDMNEVDYSRLSHLFEASVILKNDKKLEEAKEVVVEDVSTEEEVEEEVIKPIAKNRAITKARGRK